MTDDTTPETIAGADGADELDFDNAQFADGAAGALACTTCNTAIDGVYHSVNGASVCTPCRDSHVASMQGSFLTALLLGSAAGVVGAGVYYGITVWLEVNLALLTIGIGYIVALGVRTGAGARPGLVYRIMAVGLAWAAMASVYVPALMENFAADGDGEVPTVVSFIVAFGFALVLPIFQAIELELMGTLIFGFGIWYAWTVSAPGPNLVEGPFQLAAPDARPDAARPHSPSSPQARGAPPGRTDDTSS